MNPGSSSVSFLLSSFLAASCAPHSCTFARAATAAGARVNFFIAALSAAGWNSDLASAGIGRHQLEVNHWALEMGGHCRTGLEDNVRWDKQKLAPSNAALVTRVAELCAEYGRPVATARHAREMLGLRPAPAAAAA